MDLVLAARLQAQDRLRRPTGDLAASSRAAGVLREVQIELATRTDHRPVAVTVNMPAARGQGPAPAWFCRAALSLPDVQEQARELWALVPQFPPGLTADLFDKLCRLLLAEVAPPVRSSPRQPWISGATWELVCHRRAIKK